MSICHWYRYCHCFRLLFSRMRLTQSSQSRAISSIIVTALSVSSSLRKLPWRHCPRMSCVDKDLRKLCLNHFWHLWKITIKKWICLLEFHPGLCMTHNGQNMLKLCTKCNCIDFFTFLWRLKIKNGVFFSHVWWSFVISVANAYFWTQSASSCSIRCFTRSLKSERGERKQVWS